MAILDTFSGNSATYGGAIFNNGFLNVTNCTFDNSSGSGNSATFAGGAIVNNAQPPGGNMAVTNSTFVGNSATSGGAIFNSSASTFTVCHDGDQQHLLIQLRRPAGSGGGAILNNSTKPLLCGQQHLLIQLLDWYRRRHTRTAAGCLLEP